MISSKGFGKVGLVVLWGIGLVIFFMMMILMLGSGDQNVFDSEVKAEVDAQMASVQQNAVMTVILEDHLWRADGINRGKYNNFKAKKIISLYFSADPEDDSKIWFGRKTVNLGEVKEDIESYLKFKMERHWQSGGTIVEYRAIIGSETSDMDLLDVGTLNRGQGFVYSYTLPRNKGETVFIEMWVNHAKGGYGVASSAGG